MLVLKGIDETPPYAWIPSCPTQRSPMALRPSFMFPPFVVPIPIYAHDLAKKIYRISGSERTDDFIFFSNSKLLACTSSFHKVPFFNLSFSISNFATVSLILSNSERFLLVCNAANGFPVCLFGINADSPSAIYSFTHRQIILWYAWYSFSKVFTEIWSFRYLHAISAFCSGVYIRFLCPSFTLTTSKLISA